MAIAWLDHSRRQVLSWFRDDVFRRVFANAGRLVVANGIAVVLGFITVVLTARKLGPANYGVLALLFSYEQTIAKLVTFDAWQAIVKFGSEALQAGDRPAFQQLVKFGFCLDVGSATLGAALAVMLSRPIINLLGWDQVVRPLMILYCLRILFSLSGTPIGVLRLFDRFDLLSYATVLSALVTLAGVVWCTLTNQSLYGFVAMYLVTSIVANLYLILASLWVLRKEHLAGFVSRPLRGINARFPGIWEFVWSTNLTATVRLLSREADGLVLASLTTPFGLGLFRVAKQFSSVLPKTSDALSQSIYPELARSWAKGDKRQFVCLSQRATVFTGTVALAAWVGFVVFGRSIISHTLGSSFQGAYPVTVLYMLAMVAFLCCFTLTPSILAMGLARISLVATLCATLAYFALLFPCVMGLGLVGASVAYLGFFVVWAVLMMLCLAAHLNRHAVPTDVVEPR